MTAIDRQPDGRAPAVPLPETGPRPSAPVAAGPVSPTPAAGMGVPAAGPDPISRWGGEGGPNCGKGGPPEHRCTCGHLDVFHNYGKRCGVQVRTGCSISDGAKAVPCGCPLYQEAS